MKKTIADLAGLLLLLAAPVAVQGQFTWMTNAGTITITGYTGPGGAVAIPTNITGLPVTSIGEDAFALCTNLANLTIPNSVTSIGNYAFIYCFNLASVTIGDSAGLPVASIGEDAFGSCTNLADVTIGNSVTNIGEFAFDFCDSLASITIGTSVTGIGTNAFFYCTNLTSVCFEGNASTNFSENLFEDAPVTVILHLSGATGWGANFEGISTAPCAECGGDLQVTITPSNVVSAGAGWQVDGGADQDSGATVTDLSPGDHTISFRPVSGWNTPANQTVAITQGATTTATGDYAVQFIYTTNADNTITITGYTGPGGVVTIPTSINGLSVTSIGDGAFSYTSLTSIVIPASVTNIVIHAFDECHSLRTIAVDAQNSFYSSANGVLFDKGQTSLVQYPGGLGGSYTIPGGVTVIGQGAFAGCTNLTNVTIPSSVTSIGTDAFSFTSLVSVTIPASVTNIAIYAFDECYSLTAIVVDAQNSFYSSTNGVLFDKNQTSLMAYPTGLGGSYTIPGTVTGIASIAFEDCTSLTSVTIPGRVTNIGDYAFSGCSNLASVYFDGNAPTADATVFLYDSKVTVYYMPGTSGWSNTAAGIPAVMLNPPLPAGSLQMTITPAGAITAGAQWQVDGGFPQPSGATVLGLSVGNHTVSFSSVGGWKTPGNQITSVSANSTATASGNYGGGSLQVMINPEGAITAEATWEVDGGAPQNSGVTVTNLSASGHVVSFTPISGWISPPDQDVAITGGVTTWASGIYTLSNAPGDVLTLITNGAGTIQHGTWPKDLMILNKYKVTAAPESKNVFSSWVGGSNQPYSVLSTNLVYTFTMESNFVLEANFVTNVFVAAQGTYRGLFAPANSARQQTNSGSFLLSVTSSGSVSGNLDLGGQTVPFSGKFDVGGAAAVVLKREPSLTITMQLDFADQSVSGTISNEAFTAELNGYRDVFSSSDEATEFEGQYTLVIPGTNNPTVGPFGTSYGTVKVDDLGNIKLAGSLADGTAISQSSVVARDGYWPLYLNLYGGKGSLWAWNYFTSNRTITAPSALSWINATNSSKAAVYRTGFTNQQAALIGGIYTSSLPFPTDLTTTLQESNLPAITNKLTLKTNKTTGVISGSFANPGEPKQSIKVNGVILQGQTNAQGYFLGTNQSGIFLLESP